MPKEDKKKTLAELAKEKALVTRVRARAREKAKKNKESKESGEELRKKQDTPLQHAWDIVKGIYARKEMRDLTQREKDAFLEIYPMDPVGLNMFETLEFHVGLFLFSRGSSDQEWKARLVMMGVKI